ncbi:MAG: flagellar biosynthetic protein FliQ [Candidatus Margulisbacteria bacterium]|nr:flagellar biosynthetic protein FliQ [Candidatus Margulisiibacteriota bacterium]
MTVDIASSMLTQGITLLLLLSGPCIGLGLLVGFMVSLFQALTQIQEQTLTFVPKMVVVMLVLALTFSWIASQMVSFANGLWLQIPALVR